MWRLLFLVALSACVPSRVRHQQMVDAGWFSQARYDASSRQRAALDAYLWERLDLQLSLEIVPVEAFGLPPRGYGESWWMIAVGFERRADLDEGLALGLVFDTLEPCTSCDANWIRQRMAPEGASSTPSKGDTSSDPSSNDSFFQAIFDAVDVSISMVLLPITLVADLGIALTGAPLLDPDFKPLGFTSFTMNALLGTDGNGGRVVHSAVAEEDGRLRCAHNGPCAATLVFLGEEPPTQLEVSAVLESTLNPLPGRSVTIDLRGDSFSERLGGAFPATGLRVVFEPEP